MSDRRRIVVTGLGCVSPLGNSVAEAWSACSSGKSGIGPITHFDASEFRTQIAGEVRNYQVPDIVSPKEARKMELFIRYAVGAATEALQDANLEITEELEEETGVSMEWESGDWVISRDTRCWWKREDQNGFLPSSSQ